MSKDRYIVKLSGKYAKKALTGLEKLYEELDPEADRISTDTRMLIRKLVLDGFADYSREIETIQNSE